MISAAAPVIVVTAVAFIATVVLLSKVLSAEAATEASVTFISSAWPVSVIPASVAILPSIIVAVITPVVWAARVLNWATVNDTVVSTVIDKAVDDGEVLLAASVAVVVNE